MRRSVDSGRDSLVGIEDSFGAVKESLHACSTLLESLARELQSDTITSNIDKTKQEEWSRKVLELAENNVAEINKLNQTQTFLDAYAASSRRIDEDSAALRADQTLNDVKNDLKRHLQPFDATKDKFAKKIKSILQDVDEEDEEDIRELEQGDTDAMFTCPYTRTRMEVPMKNSACSHHISKVALDALLASAGRAGRAKCPIAGCRAQWSSATSSVDKTFQYRMERHFRLQSVNTAADTRATYIKDEDEDDGYTQL